MLRPAKITIALFGAMAMGIAGFSPGAAQQAAAGGGPAARSLYVARCSGCHGYGMEGGQFGPTLQGAKFAAKWKGKRAELLKLVATKMPPNAGGTLTEAQYAALVDLIVAANAGAGAGQAASADAAPGGLGPRPASPELYLDATSRAETARQQALLAALSPVTAEMLRSPPEGEWLSWRRTQDDLGYSPLKQIDRSTVSGLRLKWAWSMTHGRNEIAPLIHDGVMFINSAYEVEALEAATGTLLWHYSRDIPAEYRGPLNMVQRNMAIFGRLLYVPTADRHIVALDIATGKVVWDTEVIPPSMPSAVLSSGPLVADNIVVEGTSIGAFCLGGCYVVGLDAATGKRVWRFDNVARPGSPGGDSWNGTPAADRSGAAVWSTATYDPGRDVIYFGTGNVYDISRVLKGNPAVAGQTGDALYTDSTIALRPATGELVWYHQHFPHEVWDLDEAFERSLVTLPVNGQERPLIVTIGKVGILDALDRENGHYVFSIDLGLNNLVKAIDPQTGRRTIDPARIPTAEHPAVEVCPSVQGVRNWMATAFDPVNRVLYLPMQESCMDFTWVDSKAATDAKLGMGWTSKPPPGSDGLYGHLEAIDMTTRKPLWINRTRTLPDSSLLATAGGMLFSGNSDRFFRALDEKTGKVLWEERLNAPPNATPVTFTVGGKQYVAIVSGGGGDNESQVENLTPELMQPAPATTIWVFGL